MHGAFLLRTCFEGWSVCRHRLHCIRTMFDWRVQCHAVRVMDGNYVGYIIAFTLNFFFFTENQLIFPIRWRIETGNGKQCLPLYEFLFFLSLWNRAISSGKWNACMLFVRCSVYCYSNLKSQSECRMECWARKLNIKKWLCKSIGSELKAGNGI